MSEDDPIITVYQFDNNGLGGVTHDSIEGILDDVRVELENWERADTPITLTVKTSTMRRSEHGALPEFEGY